MGALAATKCIKCGSFQGEPCKVCGQRLPQSEDGKTPPRKCTECDSHQNWFRRGLGSVQVPVALLAGIFGLVGLTVPAVERYLWPTEITRAAIDQDSAYLQVVFTNHTDAEALLIKAEIKSSFLKPPTQEVWLASRANKDNPAEEGKLDPPPYTLSPGTHLLRFQPQEKGLTLRAKPRDGTPIRITLDVAPHKVVPRMTLKHAEYFLCEWESSSKCEGNEPQSRWTAEAEGS